ncbi:unnamed protein product [Pylaiella littoralis]
MKVIQFVAAALVAAPSAAFFMPVGTNSFVAQQRVSSRSSVTAVRMAEATPELEQEVMAVVGEQLGKEGSVTMTSNFIDDLGADSLDTVELIMSLEEKFDIDIAEEEAQKMVCVKDAVDYIAANK